MKEFFIEIMKSIKMIVTRVFIEIGSIIKKE